MKSPYSLKFHHDVEKDLLQASSWYQQKMIGLGDEFLDYFYSSAKVILENSFRYSKGYKNYRRYLFHKFP
jgi:hypothetical protein